MKYGISIRRGLPVSVAAAGQEPVAEFSPLLLALAESEHDDERVDLVELAALVQYARTPV